MQSFFAMARTPIVTETNRIEHEVESQLNAKAAHYHQSKCIRDRFRRTDYFLGYCRCLWFFVTAGS